MEENIEIHRKTERVGISLMKNSPRHHAATLVFYESGTSNS